MLNKRIINTGGGGAACTTDTTQILDAGTTQSTALYRFEDNANDTADSSGKFGKGAIFNGSSSKIQLPNNLINAVSAQTFSVSFWFKNNNLTAYGNPFSAYAWAGGVNYGWSIYTGYGNSKLRFLSYSSNGNIDVSGTTTLVQGTWYHAVVTYTGGTIVMYLNGSQEYSGSPSSGDRTYITNHTYYIGAANNGAGGTEGYFTGAIDDVRVYTDVLTSTEVGYIYNNTTASIPTSNLLAYYKLNGNANDETSNYNNGTASNVIYDYSGTASNVTYATGKFGKAAVFNGSNSSIILPQNTDFDLNGAGSFSIWVNRNNTTRSWIFEKANGGSGTYSWQLEYNGGYRFQMHDTSNNAITAVTGSSGLAINTWEHIVVTSSASKVYKIYFNGVLKDTKTLSGTVSVNTNGPRFGEYSLASGYSFNGEIDQTRFFNKELSPGEINSLYNETATSAASGTIDNPSTIAYYKMNDASDETKSYNGTASNVDFNVQGKYGFAGKFNGSSSYISTNLYQERIGSFSFWMKRDSTPSSSEMLVAYNGASSALKGFFAQLQTDGDIRLVLNKGTSGTNGLSIYSSGVNTSDGSWHHVAVAWDITTQGSTNSYLYIDGSLNVSGTADDGNWTSGNSSDTYIFGSGSTSNSQVFEGSLDQVRIFNRVISAAEVTTLYNEVQCANPITTPEDYFNTKLYTGNGGTQAITGVGFAPGMTWIKARSVGYSHSLQDTLRGPGTATSIYPDLNSPAGTYGMYGQISAFGTDGFTVAGGGHGSYPTAQVNQNGVTYASWNWKTANSTTTNNDGATQSTVRASQESGFSVVKYTGTGSTTTVGHGLNKKPNLIIFKGLGATGTGDAWPVYASPITADFTLYLYHTYQAINDALNYNDTEPTSSVFTVGTWNGINKSSVDYVAYCISNIDGYQRVGSFIGNGSANGPFIYTGFEPAWIIFKNTDTAYRWYMLDNKRNTTNPRRSRLFANDPTAETTNSDIVDFHTNGFQIINSDAEVNKSGDKILFWAIAANPDTTAPTKANSFKAKLYTGNGDTSNDTLISGIGFKPDLVWAKSRNDTYNHLLMDSVRGTTSLSANDTTTERTNYSRFVSYEDDGFKIRANNAGDLYKINRTNTNYVAWNWKAADHDRNLASINNDGSIISLVSANPAAGFSIVKWTGTGVNGTKIGHGLEGSPEMIITKGLSNATSWVVGIGGVSGMNVNDYLTITEYDKSTLSNFYQAYSTNTFQVGVSAANEMNKSTSNNYISYCFRSISGISKIGTYTGNGSTTGPITTTGFEPQFLLVKRLDANARWVVWDNKRDPSNTRTTGLNIEGNYAEITNFDVDFLSNGFQLKDAEAALNANGGTYLYMTFK